MIHIVNNEHEEARGRLIRFKAKLIGAVLHPPRSVGQFKMTIRVVFIWFEDSLSSRPRNGRPDSHSFIDECDMFRSL